jgi:putative flavoprotein involved in K+ transport
VDSRDDANDDIGDDTGDDATREAEAWLAAFADALARGDAAAAAALFGEPGYWRDLIALTWNIRTFEDRASIAAMLDAALPTAQPTGWALSEPATRSERTVQAWLRFETATGRGTGLLRLRDGKAWTLLTALTELKGHEEKQGPTREQGTQHGAFRHRRNWRQRREEEAAELGTTVQPYCLIVGGGQGGLGLGARLKRLGVPTLIVDRLERPGDAWRRRYDSLCLHDPVWYDHMPYLPFPEHWPVFTPKDKMGDWLESYCTIMELDYWSSTECRSASYDEAAGEWTVEVLRDSAPVTLRPKHLVLATGMSGVPKTPVIPGAGTFAGTLHHSSAHRGGAGWEGRNCVVVGSINSAHDIAADLWEHDANVTMVQRLPTLVVRSETLGQLATRRLYSEEALAEGMTTGRADFTVASVPFAVQPDLQRPVYEQVRQQDADFYAKLEAAGFLLTFGEDEAGLSTMYMRRGSGYYIDVGASELISDGRIGLRSGVEPVEIRPGGLVLNDGEELPADLIVFATGYGSMNGWAAELISQDVADRVGKCWGLGSGTKLDPGPWEGELRNMWKPTAQDGLWFHGGNLAQSRFYSRILALQLKARFEGIDTPVHCRTPVHHPG